MSQDRTPPTVTLAGSAAFLLQGGLAFMDPGYQADDTCQGDITSRVLVAGLPVSGPDATIVGRTQVSACCIAMSRWCHVCGPFASAVHIFFFSRLCARYLSHILTDDIQRH